MAGDDVLRAIQSSAFRERLVDVRRIPGKDAQVADWPAKLRPKIRERLHDLGVPALYSHQSKAVELALERRDVAVVTGTGSGKTLCYHLPTLDACLGEPRARALYLFPTKALAQDQLGKIVELAHGMSVRSATYDGDTPRSERSAIRRNANVVLTNPDMLHLGILPNHEIWGDFLKSLRLIVIDEMHAYRGIFGCHVGGIVRRLIRLCEWRGAHPPVVACSATIANPAELFERLVGRKPHVIDSDGAPRGERTLMLLDHPDVEAGVQVSVNRDVAEILAALATEGIRTLAFCRARITTELVLKMARDALTKLGSPPEWVAAYRAGYTPEERRKIERALFDGELRGLATTSAMELGVDVGGLDVTLLNGYPGTLASFWQQIGRAGRGGRPGLAALFAHADPLEQFLVRHGDLLERPEGEPVALNPANEQVLGAQLKCAAYERPLSPSELERFGPTALEVAEKLQGSGDLDYDKKHVIYYNLRSTAGETNIRTGGGRTITLLVGERVIGDMERWRALRNAHPGAIYLHAGDTYRVETLDLVRHEARLKPMPDADHFTMPNEEGVVERTVQLTQLERKGYAIELCGLHVTQVISGYRRIAADAKTVLNEVTLDLPPEEKDTVGVRVHLPAEFALEEDPEVIGAIHGIEHALMATAPIVAGCDPGDLGSAWFRVTVETLAPAIAVYDEAPGGVGLSEELYKRRERWLELAETLIDGCGCQEGCPRCLLSSRCPHGNRPLSKSGTLAMLRRLRTNLTDR